MSAFVKNAHVPHGRAFLTSSFRGVPGIDEVEGVKEFVLDMGGLNMRRPSLSKRPAGVVFLLSTTGVPAPLDWGWEVGVGTSLEPTARSRFLFAATRAFAAPWSCCRRQGIKGQHLADTSGGCDAATRVASTGRRGHEWWRVRGGICVQLTAAWRSFRSASIWAS